MKTIPEIEVRFADKNDSEALVQFTRALLNETRIFGGHEVNQDETFWLKFQETIIERINEPDRLFILANMNSRTVAYLEGHIQKFYDTFAPKRSFHINGVYVTPESRRQGVAESLVQEALQWAKEKKCHEADLNVLVGNHAKVLYEKAGFRAFQHEMRLKL
jgi:GNAT superfamily N-acetyltransferase